ncbi:hypothetical protein QTO34_014860 [Cnephaeus nilssonii]|uniref:Uncharacterized protein n=1 Tax=Cnephaeus nilssonii TaxID=3371016 RepID=A0AA40LSP6_CNENI|nr:hypothetical protein QTO34_014860 [Eptesicus nilssonii]
MTSAGDCRKWLEQVLCPLSTQARLSSSTPLVYFRKSFNTSSVSSCEDAFHLPHVSPPLLSQQE